MLASADSSSRPRSAILMFNVIEDTPEISAARLANRSASLGAGAIDIVELGNENWALDQTGGNLGDSCDPITYVDFTKQVDAALKVAVPGIKTAVNVERDDFSTGSWNDHLANESWYDACVLHAYVRVDTTVTLNAASVAGYLGASTIMATYFEGFRERFGMSRPLVLSEWGVLGGNSDEGQFFAALGEADMWLAVVGAEVEHPGLMKQAGLHTLYSESNANMALFRPVAGDDSTSVASPVSDE